MHFNRLRIHGFKSFVEPTHLEIPEGMTGIVGPNGCGKSNLVEALRWVMGENSAKRMRGAEMDDVIFAGTSTRPSRNLAEVTLELGNPDHTATAEFNNDETMQVTRRIERGSGSDYRVNGKPVRQKDVQLLFADQATGAHSTNLVGQGQIDALIRAKPQDRRAILEEASGTSGLHTRRHEAELKLKAAELNLTRVDDVLKALDTQLRSLKQQVRQASRYRNLADHIRKTEAALLHLKWQEAEQNAENAHQALREAETHEHETLSYVTQGHTARTDIASTLPERRQAEATAAAIVQKINLAREQIETETRRLADETRAKENLLAQAQADREREVTRLTDGESSLIKLQDEQKQLIEQTAIIADNLPTLSHNITETTAQVETLDGALTLLLQTIANAEATQKSLLQEIEKLTAQRGTLESKRTQLTAQRDSLCAEMESKPDLSLASAMLDATESELAKKQQHAQNAEQFYHEAQQIETQARDVVQQTESRATKIKAEVNAISALLQHHNDKSDQVLDLISVTPGLETALAVALGESLTAALDAKAAMHWRDLPPLDNTTPLPANVLPIRQYIDAPPALDRSLSQVGLVPDAEVGEMAAQHLRPGQIIVSRDGWAWRWDGYTVTPDAKTASALRLQQKNRLTALQKELESAEAEAQKAREALTDSTAFFQQRQTEDRNARESLKAAFAALNDARANYARQEKEAHAVTAKLTTSKEALQQIENDIEQIQTRLITAENERKTLPDIEAQRLSIAEKRAQLAEYRSQQAHQQSERDRLIREQNHATNRRETIARELEAWQTRLGNAGQHIESLAERITATENELQQLRGRPAELTATHTRLLSEHAEAETRRKEAADNLIATEQKLQAVEQQLKKDETAQGDAREERVRAQAAVQAVTEHFNILRERMTEKLNCGPEELPTIAAFDSNDTLPSLFELEQALGRYLRERENMGAVNLRAETEAETVQAEIDKLQKEQEDLTAAIAKLRQGIGQLNREARERLQGAFGLVNERFQNLFKRLFNGGQAHLELVDNDDPLNAGLEIYASPPGKKMQILSLLSGGERTLTALALLFAVFQTNPSPICVLDEAEAALDEGNIGRFCTLVEDIARETGTRFLIITHQRLTMAKMDRLYGVTMSEKGVSQLVSVDLANAVAIRDGEKIDTLAKAEEALGHVRVA